MGLVQINEGKREEEENERREKKVKEKFEFKSDFPVPLHVNDCFGLPHPSSFGPPHPSSLLDDDQCDRITFLLRTSLEISLSWHFQKN